jgi:hypothetical protein
MAEMLYYNEICAAIRRLVQSGAALTADTEGSDRLAVGSNRVFSVGDTVVLTDAAGDRETHTVVELIGLTGLRLDTPVSGSFTLAGGAELRRLPEVLGDLKWVGQGQPELGPQPAENMLPCIIVQPARMEQPLTAGTNRAYQQNYHCRVYYLRRAEPGEAASVALMDQAAELFGLLMADPYLGGSAWYAQVVAVEPEAAAIQKLRDGGLPVVGVEMEVVAQRLAMVG